MRLLTASLAVVLLAGSAPAQNAPLSGLPERGAVQASDIIPIQPAGGPQLMQTTVAALAVGASGAGTVSSIGVSLPSPWNCTGSPVTTSGTIACTVGAQSANTVYAGPPSSGTAMPGFRALVGADLPASGVTPGTYGDSADVAEITVDAKGRVTSATTTPIVLPSNPYLPGVPQVSAWTAVNSSGLTTQQSSVSGSGLVQALSLVANYQNGDNVQGLCRAAPATPYRVVVWSESILLSAADQSYAMGIYDPVSGKLETFGILDSSGQVLFWSKFNSFTSLNTFTSIQSQVFAVWFAIENDGTNVYFETSGDSIRWTKFVTQPLTGSFMPAWTDLCIFIDPNFGSDSSLSGVPWYATYLTYDESGASRTTASVY